MSRRRWAVSYTAHLGGQTIPGERPCDSMIEAETVLAGLPRSKRPALVAVSHDEGRTWHPWLVDTGGEA